MLSNGSPQAGQNFGGFAGSSGSQPHLSHLKPLAAWGGMVLAAVCKLAALYVVLVKLVAPMIVPAAKLTAVTAAFTWPQLVTALIGGVLACLIAPPVRRALEK